jgi:anti-sigma B factor antagonist
LIGVEMTLSSSNGAARSRSTPAVEAARSRPFSVDVRRADGAAIVRPHGELDLATVETLRHALDGIESPGRLVLDLRGLSFIDATGLRLLMELHHRAQRDGLPLTLVGPAARADRAIRLCGLDQVLPFAAPVDAVDRQPTESASLP